MEGCVIDEVPRCSPRCVPAYLPACLVAVVVLLVVVVVVFHGVVVVVATRAISFFRTSIACLGLWLPTERSTFSKRFPEEEPSSVKRITKPLRVCLRATATVALASRKQRALRAETFEGTKQTRENEVGGREGGREQAWNEQPN